MIFIMLVPKNLILRAIFKSANLHVVSGVLMAKKKSPAKKTGGANRSAAAKKAAETRKKNAAAKIKLDIRLK